MFLDSSCHASLADGGKLASGTTAFFRHNSVESLAKRLRTWSHQGEGGALVAVDGVVPRDQTDVRFSQLARALPIDPPFSRPRLLIRLGSEYPAVLDGVQTAGFAAHVPHRVGRGRARDEAARERGSVARGAVAADGVCGERSSPMQQQEGGRCAAGP